VFTAGEQLFLYTKQFQNTPKHCKRCRAKHNLAFRKPVRPETRTTCAECGSETTVPFKPTQGRPVLCRACFEKTKVASRPRRASTRQCALRPSSECGDPIPAGIQCDIGRTCSS
jgi:CxxC-x17-CxxC domain-containing protein